MILNNISLGAPDKFFAYLQNNKMAANYPIYFMINDALLFTITVTKWKTFLAHSQNNKMAAIFGNYI